MVIVPDERARVEAMRSERAKPLRFPAILGDAAGGFCVRWCKIVKRSVAKTVRRQGTRRLAVRRARFYNRNMFRMESCAILGFLLARGRFPMSTRSHGGLTRSDK